ncbi:MAG: ROK family protein [Candidatus Eisenbacteria bacterium]
MKRTDSFSRYVMGVDLGATMCRAALLSLEGRLGNRLETRFAPGKTGEEDRAVFFRVLEDLLSGEKRAGLSAVGVGSFGPLDRERARIEEAPNRPGWKGFPLRAAVEERFGVPVALENDANAATFGEYRRGAGRGAHSLLGLTIGTGIGGGFVAEGKILTGAGGGAAEFGHIYVGGDGVRCRCGALDCLEAYASAEGIKRSYLARAEGAPALSCHGIFHLARGGDPIAAETIERAALLLGRAIASLQKALDPERIVIGGGLSREWDLLVEPAIREARANLFPSRREDFRVLPAALGTDAGVVGAGELALEIAKNR